MKTYRDKMPARLPLSANEEFKSVRNAVIAEALNLSFSSTPVIEETPAEPTDKEIEKSEKKSRKDYKTAWQFYDWAKACTDKNGENYNPEFAVKLFTEAANGGITVAKYKLGKMFLNGDGVEKDIVKAVEWLKQAALEENEFAEYALGRLYLQGEEVEKDTVAAEDYLLKAVKHGNKYAEYVLGKEYLRGKNFPKDVEKAIDYLKHSAGKNFDFAEYTLGRIYLFGLGVEKDLPLAMEYLRSAAARGNEYAAEVIKQKELWDKQSISLCISRLFKYLCGVLQEKAETVFSAKITRTDKKLRRRIAEKKQAQGLKLE